MSVTLLMCLFDDFDNSNHVIIHTLLVGKTSRHHDQSVPTNGASEQKNTNKIQENEA